MNKRIEDNESFKKLKQQVSGVETLIKLYKFSKFFGYKNPDLDKMIEEIPGFKMS